MSKRDEKDSEDEARKKILARRATFVAAALAGVSTACGKEPTQPPQPCLSVVNIEDGAAPQPCLEPVPPPEDDAGAPQPCLKVAAPPTEASDAGKPIPMPCLTPVRPNTTQTTPLPDGGKPLPQPCLKIVPPGSR